MPITQSPGENAQRTGDDEHQGHGNGEGAALPVELPGDGPDENAEAVKCHRLNDENAGRPKDHYPAVVEASHLPPAEHPLDRFQGGRNPGEIAGILQGDIRVLQSVASNNTNDRFAGKIMTFPRQFEQARQ